jgi:hypothetical protein
VKDSTSTIGRKGRRIWTSAEERQQWIKAWEASGQTQEAFAESNGLCVGTLRNWIRRQASPPARSLTVREISVADVLGPDAPARGGDWEFEIRLPSGVVLAVARGTPGSRVRELLEALRC